MKEIVSWLSIGAAAVSTITGVYAAFWVTIRDNQDMFISDLATQSKWASIAAVAAGISVLLQAAEKLLK